MRFVKAAAAAALVLLFAPTMAAAADPPMAGMPMGPMSMGGPMAPMPAIYNGDADKAGAPMFKGLGDHKHPISTKNAQTQAYFDQGVNLLFGFNHAEAIRSFREAARLDPDCAMCWWGVAIALGPNINLPMFPDAVTPAWEALQRARALEPKASPEEREWIEALATRYSADPKADRHALDEAYARAMGRLWKSHPDDLDAGVFYAEAMMDTQPWDLWELDQVTPKGHALEIVAVLEDIIRRAPNHPGALHLYIHAVEGSTTPERAEAAADRLEVLMPGAGHIVHMPSHIYYWVGRYADAVRVNALAATVDEDYIAQCKAQGFYPVGYYVHNIHFQWTSSAMQGRYQAAIDAARRVVKAIHASPDAAANGMPYVDLYELTPVETQLRFGKWDALLAEPAPPAERRVETVIWLYARGFAHANKGDLAAAREDRAKIVALTTADYSAYDAQGIPARQMVDLALNLLNGEIARKSGDLSQAIAFFRQAARIQHSLPYTEPPYWHQPVSHIFGAALLEAGQPKEAEAVYRESLKTYRGDGWALFGLAQALDAQGRHDEAAKVRAEQKTAWTFADVTLTSSRF